MNINRYNYEEYLMLYIDGELSPSEKQQVESFLQQNPDVKEEFELLQQTVLQPEHIAFADKHSLYKKDTGINLNNYEEYFLLYIDNELSHLEKEAVETFVLQQPQLQERFTLLKQTILPQEKLVFANKEVLYRKEEKKRPVAISINYRWASLAAAVMIGIVALVWIFRADNSINGTERSTASKTQPAQPDNNKTSIDNNQTQPSQTLPYITDNDKSLAVEEAKKQENVVSKENANQPQITVTKENIASLDNQQREQEQTVAVIPNNFQVKSNTNITLPDNISVSTDDPYTNVAVTPATDDKNYTAKPVVNEELNVADEDDKKTLLLGSMQINKDKLRGFFRKAGRFLGNKVKPEEGKLQVANMEIK